MNVGELFVKIGIDSGDFTSQLDKIDARLKQIASLSNLNMSVGGTKGFSDIAAGADKMRAALQSALPIADQLKMRLQEQQTKYGVLSSQLAATVSKYGETSQAAQKQQLALQKLDNAINQTKLALDQLGKESTDTANEMTKVSTNANSMGSMLQNALSFAGGQLLAQGIQAVSAAVVGGIRSATDFEAALSGVSAVAGGLTSGQLEQLRAKALQIGADTSLSASQAVQAFEALVANGIDPTAASFNGIADSTVALSEATGSDLTTAANVATDVIQNFAGAGNDLAAVVNGITGVTVAGKFGIDDYRLALSNGGVAVAGLGVSLSDFNTGLAAVSSAFSSGQTAGTAFRTFVERLTPSTNTAKEAMQALGLITEDGANKFYNLDGSLKSMSEIFGIVQNAFGGLTEQSKAAFAEQIFGAEAINFVTAATRTGTEGFNEYAAAIAEVNAADIAAERLNNLQGATEQFKGSLETLSITVFGAITPALTQIVQAATGVVNQITTVTQAIMGSQEAFNSLPPAVQYVVSVIQQLGSYFNSLASAASGWGNAIGTNFANGIIAAAQAVVNALMEMGSIISYWLTPGSPPPLLPDLDTWGTEAAQVYLDSFNDADFSTLQTMGNLVKDTLTSLFDAGAFAKQDIIPTVLGTREAFAQVQTQLNQTGKVGESAINNLLAATGSARSVVEPVIRAYFEAEEATRIYERAQRDLTDAQDQLNAITEQYEKVLDPIKDQIRAITEEEKALDRQDRIAELQDQLANTGDDSKDALTPLQKQLKAVTKQQKLLELDKKIAEYKIQTADTNPEFAQAAALKLTEAELEKQQLLLEDQVDIEKQKEDARRKEIADRKAQLELQRLVLEDQVSAIEKEQTGQESIAKTRIDAAALQLESAKATLDIANQQYALEQQRINALKEQNALIKEQMTAQTGEKSGGGGGGGSAMSAAQKAAEAAKKAQDQYNYSIADTDGKLAILKDRLAGVEQGSAEYYQILGQINSLEKQKASEQDAIAQKAAAEAEARRKAELQYNMQISDTQGKLALLRGELANVEVGSTEYYNILGQIAQLEAQAAKEAENAAKGVGKVGGAGGAAAGGLKPMQAALGDITALTPPAITAQNELAGSLQNTGNGANAAATPTQRFNELMTMLTPILTPVQAALTATGNAITSFFTPAFQAAAPLLQQTGTLLQQLGAQFLAVFGEMIPPIMQSFQQTMTALGPVFEALRLGFAGFIAGAIGVFNGFVSLLIGALPGIGQMFAGTIQMINGWLELFGAAFSGVIDLVAALIVGDYSNALDAARTMSQNITAAIGNIFKGWVTALIGIVSALVSGFVGLFEGMYESVTGTSSNLAQDVSNWFTQLKDNAIQFISDMVNGIIQWFTDLYEQAVGHSIIPDMVEAILEWLTTLKDRALEFITTLVTNALAKITEFKNNAVNFFTQMVSSIVSKAQEWATNVSAKAEELKGKVTTAVETLKTNAAKAFEDAKKATVETFSKMVSDAASKAEELKGKVTSALDKVPGAISGMANSFTSAAKGIGDAIISGITSGISSGVEAIKRAARDAAQSALDAAKGLLGIKSPSSVFRDQVAGNIIEGMRLGLMDVDPVQNAMSNLVGNLTAPLGTIPQSTTLAPQGVGSSVIINLDLRGSDLSEDRVKAIVLDSFKEVSRTTTRIRGI